MAFISDGKGRVDDPGSDKWFHGSPLLLVELADGSSITRNRQIAEAFSHKPTQLNISSEGIVTHNGQEEGYLYEVDEPLSAEDYVIHPSIDKSDPWECVTRRALRLRLIAITAAK